MTPESGAGNGDFEEAAGSPVEKADTMGEIGHSGFRFDMGLMREEFLPELRGDRALETFREMRDNDPTIGSILGGTDMLMRQVQWWTDPATDKPEAQGAADFTEECRGDMSHSWEDTLSAALSMLPYGWSYMETVYKRRRGDSTDAKMRSKYDDGRVGWRKFALRAQESRYKWELDENGGVKGMWQYGQDYQPLLIPIERALLFRTSTATGNPEGRSILRNAYRPWVFKKRIEEIEAIGIERDLAGYPVYYVPESLFKQTGRTPEEVAAWEAAKKTIRNIRRDSAEGAILPAVFNAEGNRLYELTLLTTGGRRQFETDKIITRYDSRIAMQAFADFVMLAHEGTGSYALGSAKIDLFTAALGAWLDAMTGVYNTHALPRLLRINAIPRDLTPAITHSDVKQIDPQIIAEVVERLTRVGWMTPEPEGENYLREMIDMPAVEHVDELDEEELLPADGILDLATATPQQIVAATKHVLRKRIAESQRAKRGRKGLAKQVGRKRAPKKAGP